MYPTVRFGFFMYPTVRFGAVLKEGENPTVRFGAVNRAEPHRTDRKNRTVKNLKIMGLRPPLFILKRHSRGTLLLRYGLERPVAPQPRAGGRPVYGSVCLLLCFVCCICSALFVFCFFFRLNTSSPSGAVGVDTFHPGYSSFPRLTPRLADGPREVFRKTSPLY